MSIYTLFVGFAALAIFSISFNDEAKGSQHARSKATQKRMSARPPSYSPAPSNSSGAPQAGDVSAQQSRRTIDFFRTLNAGTVHLVDQFYDRNVRYIDPLGEIQTAAALKEYFTKLYSRAKSIRVAFNGETINGNDHVFQWTMFLSASGLNGGREFATDGISFIRFGGTEGKVIYQRDYFDMGQLAYEQIPVLKNVVGVVKKKISGSSGNTAGTAR